MEEKYNREIRNLYEHPDITSEIKAKRIRWAGHILMKEEGCLLKEVLNGIPEGRRPRIRWWDQVRRDMYRRLEQQKERQKVDPGGGDLLMRLNIT